MRSRQSAALTFRLAAPGVGYAVDVAVRGFADRWVVTASVGERREVGLARTPRAALDVALGWLPVRDRRALVADTTLLAPSVQLAALIADARGRDPHPQVIPGARRSTPSAHALPRAR